MLQLELLRLELESERRRRERFEHLFRNANNLWDLHLIRTELADTLYIEHRENITTLYQRDEIIQLQGALKLSDLVPLCPEFRQCSRWHLVNPDFITGKIRSGRKNYLIVRTTRLPLGDPYRSSF